MTGISGLTLDPVVQRVIGEVPPGIPSHLGPAEVRAYMTALSDLIFFRHTHPSPAEASVSEHLVPASGGRLRIRLYRPPSEGTVLPAHLMIHGGGWKLGSIDERVNDALARWRCSRAQCVVAAVEYRLAPEHRFPVPLEDCYAALVWLVQTAGALGIDPLNVSVGGVSAGANLAAALTLLARRRGGPSLVFQLLEVPALDLTRGMARQVLASDAIPPGVPQPTMDDAIKVYLTTAADALDPLASPMFEPDLSGLPAAIIMTAEFDMLRAEGEAYADRLRAAGVVCQSRRYPGALHGTSTWTRTWAPAMTWQRDAMQALHAAHHPTDQRP